MSKTLLRAIATVAVLIAALPGAALAASVDLSIYSITGSPDPIPLGTGNVTYTVQVYNSSSSAGTNVVLTSGLPASSTYVSSTASNSGTCSQSAGTVTCSWPSIAAGRRVPPARAAQQTTHIPPPLHPLIRPFFFNDTATTEIYTLSLHDALPISPPRSIPPVPRPEQTSS